MENLKNLVWTTSKTLCGKEGGDSGEVSRKKRCTLPSMEPLRKNLSSAGWKSRAVTKSVCLHKPNQGDTVPLGAVKQKALWGKGLERWFSEMTSNDA